jgi:hypothetical protein
VVHITNGDCAAELIREAGIPGAVVPWRDALHEGPVPDGLSLDELSAVRARFIAGVGWGAFERVLGDLGARDRALADCAHGDEVILWFEHDLYDQLQLLQVLDWLAGPSAGAARLSLVCDAEYLGSATPARLRERFPRRRSVSLGQLALAGEAWAAFRSPDPSGLADLLARDTAELPFLRAALRRHLQQFPSVSGGLSRSEAQALGAVAAGITRLREVYVASHHRQEDAVFLGDTVFAWYVEELSQAREPLVVGLDGRRLAAPRTEAEPAAFWNTDVRLTEIGRLALDGRADRVRVNGIDRWLGGVHLQGAPACWRWDAAAQRPVRG